MPRLGSGPVLVMTTLPLSFQSSVGCTDARILYSPQGIFSTFMVTPSGADTASYGCEESPVNTGGNVGAAPNMLAAKKARKLSCADCRRFPRRLCSETVPDGWRRRQLFARDFGETQKYRKIGRLPLTHFVPRQQYRKLCFLCGLMMRKRRRGQRISRSLAPLLLLITHTAG